MTATLRTLVARYLHAYGPATPQHFAEATLDGAVMAAAPTLTLGQVTVGPHT